MSSSNHFRKVSSPFSAALAADELDSRPKPRKLPGHVNSINVRWIPCKVELHIDIAIKNNIIFAHKYYKRSIKIIPAIIRRDIHGNGT